MQKYYTYAYLRIDRTPYYIGKGSGNRAYKVHQKGIQLPKDKSRIIFLKRNLTEQEAFKHEVYMIAVFGRIDLGTGILHNRTNGGDGASGFIFTEESKLKMSEAQKGKILSEQHKRKISESTKGVSKTEETKARMSEAQKGKLFSEESKLKMSEAQKGKKHTEETKRKKSESLKLLWENEEFKEKMSKLARGRKHTEETKAKISKASSSRTHTNETRQKLKEAWEKRKQRGQTSEKFLSKKYSFISPSGQLFEGKNISQFCREQNLCNSVMCAVLNGKRKHHKGWTVPGDTNSGGLQSVPIV
jgi:hypothetical protein